MGPDEVGGGSISLISSLISGPYVGDTPSVNLPMAGGSACHQLADAAVAAAFSSNQAQPLVEVTDSNYYPAISVKLWERP